MTEFCLLVVAKAPVPGRAKTRLCPPATSQQAAEIAAAALLDTLDTACTTPGAHPVVAFTGELAIANRAAELRAAMRPFPLLSQRGTNFADRLANAHADAAELCPGIPVLQIGMDTPQATPELLVETVDRLAGADAVLGPAEDGGWWALALRDPVAAGGLRRVPMSRPDTGRRTVDSLTRNGFRVAIGAQLSDVDTMVDAQKVAAGNPDGRFAAAVRNVE